MGKSWWGAYTQNCQNLVDNLSKPIRIAVGFDSCHGHSRRSNNFWWAHGVHYPKNFFNLSLRPSLNWFGFYFEGLLSTISSQLVVTEIADEEKMQRYDARQL